MTATQDTSLKPFRFTHSPFTNTADYVSEDHHWRVIAIFGAGWWHLTLIRVDGWQEVAKRKFKPRTAESPLPARTVTRLAREMYEERR